jgi:nucleoside-diphosphate-sugar epimerase
MAMSYFNAFNLPLTIARPFNTYGPRQSARAVIPTIISQIADGKKTIKLGDLTPTRDFNYVKDTCKGFIELACFDEAIGGIYNIGSNYEISVKDTLELIKNIMNSDVEFISENERIRPGKSEVFRLWCDNSKIKKLTGFKPDFDIKTGLKQTIDWFTKSENLSKYKTGIYNV